MKTEGVTIFRCDAPGCGADAATTDGRLPLGWFSVVEGRHEGKVKDRYYCCHAHLMAGVVGHFWPRQEECPF